MYVLSEKASPSNSKGAINLDLPGEMGVPRIPKGVLSFGLPPTDGVSSNLTKIVTKTFSRILSTALFFFYYFISNIIPIFCIQGFKISPLFFFGNGA